MACNKVLLRGLFCLFFFAEVQGCSVVPSVEQRTDNAVSEAQSRGWSQKVYHASVFQIASFRPMGAHGKQLTVYFEGDGFSWLNRNTPSLNPTPINPTALWLALSDTGNAVYLARPCQFVSEKRRTGCEKKYWTSHRFSPLIVDEIDQALTKIKSDSGADRLRLIGFSGGGAIAALLAVKRSDISYLITVAGNLDHEAWTQMHKISPLKGSLNPAEQWQKLETIPQVHLIGGRDNNTGIQVARAYAERFDNPPELRVFEFFDHNCCWAEHWPEILSTLPQ